METNRLYEWAGLLYRVRDDDGTAVDCLLGSQWHPATLSAAALLQMGARLLSPDETPHALARLEADHDVISLEPGAQIEQTNNA